MPLLTAVSQRFLLSSTVTDNLDTKDRPSGQLAGKALPKKISLKANCDIQGMQLAALGWAYTTATLG
jgi:hypothetical protein